MILAIETNKNKKVANVLQNRIKQAKKVQINQSITSNLPIDKYFNNNNEYDDNGDEKEHNDEEEMLENPYKYICTKYGLVEVVFNGNNLHNNYFAIVVRANNRYKVFQYIEHLEKIGNVTVDFFESELPEYFILKYNIHNHPNFKTSKRFGLKEFHDNSFQIKIYKINENKRHYFLNKFKPKDSSTSESLAAKYMGEIISEIIVSPELIKITEFLLKNNYKTLKFKYINEFNFSLMMAIVLSSFSRNTKLKSFIYSFEKTMIVGEFNRRCDAIYIHENSLVILEFKSNVNKKENPLEYINDRNYVKSVLAYFKEYESSVLNDITTIRQIGLEFFGKNKNHKVRITLADDLDINFCQDNNQNVSTSSFIGKKRKKIQNKKRNQSMY